MREILRVSGLRVAYPNGGKQFVYPEIQVNRGQCLAIIGPSGVGKTTLLHALFQASFPGSMKYDKGVLLDQPFTAMPWRESFRYVSLLPQYAQNSLNPALTIGRHVKHIRQGLASGADDATVLRWLEQLQLESSVVRMFPHQLSGGMRQRVVLLLGMLKRPALYVLDEPSIGIDAVTLRLMSEFLLEQKEKGMSLLLVSHEPNFVSLIADQVVPLGGNLNG